MQIERQPANRMTLEAFADKHDLTMEIVERTRTDLHHSFDFGANRFYANFKNTETKEGACLCGTHGNGGTEAQAMADYAKLISGKLLVVGAFTESRREIYVPELTAIDGGSEHG